MPLRNPLSNWSRSSAGKPGSWRDADGSINWTRVALTGGATAIGGPLVGRLTTGLYDRFNSGNTASSNYQLPMPQGPNMGRFDSAPQPGSTTTNQQLRQALETYSQQMQQQRIEAARLSAGGAPVSSSSSSPAIGAMAPRQENRTGYSTSIRQSGGSNPFDGMQRWMAATDINERVRGMVK